MFDALLMMRSLIKVTLRLDAAIPADLLHTLSLLPQLGFLEIFQARFDGTAPYSSLPFLTLESLLICIVGFKGVVRHQNIDREKQASNIVALLKNISRGLTALQISGDLLHPEFLSLTWPQLRKFTATEHTPRPYIPVPDLVSQMPALRELSILYSADVSRDRDVGDMYPPFRLGSAAGELLTRSCPFLASVTLSNLEPTDPIFAQLPLALQSLHLRAMVDGYLPLEGFPKNLWEAPLTHATALITLEKISHLEDLTELSLTLDDFATAALIQRVASVFSRLQFLELDHATYAFTPQWCFDVRDVSALHHPSSFARY